MSPVKSEQLIRMLKESNYDPKEVAFLEDGFKRGFSIEYQGPENRQSTSNNLPFTVGNKVLLWNKLMKEVKVKRVAGPFDEIPFENYIQSPIGLVPKVGGDSTRLIFHLSYDCKKDGLGSVNHFTPSEKCSVKYKDLDYAIGAYLKVLEDGYGKEHNFSRPANEDRW